MRDPNLVKLLSRAGVVVMITVPAIVYMAILAMNSVNMPVGDAVEFSEPDRVGNAPAARPVIDVKPTPAKALPKPQKGKG